MLDAGDLLHRVNIQAQTQVIDPITGTRSHAWLNAWANVPAKIEPLSGRELIVAQSVNSQVTANIVIRAIAGLTAKHRIVHGSRIYNIHGVIPDKDSGIEYATLPVSEGTNDGS